MDALSKGEVSPNEEIALIRSIIHAIMQQIEDTCIRRNAFTQLRDSWLAVLRSQGAKKTQLDFIHGAETLWELHIGVIRALFPEHMPETDVFDSSDLASVAANSRLLEWLNILGRLEETKVRIDERMGLQEVRRVAQRIILAIMEVLDKAGSTDKAGPICPSCGAPLAALRQEILVALRKIGLQYNIANE